MKKWFWTEILWFIAFLHHRRERGIYALKAPNLSGQDLRNLDLRGLPRNLLVRVDAEAADLRGSVLSGDTLSDFADVRGADLRDARITSWTPSRLTDLQGTKLDGVEFCGIPYEDVPVVAMLETSILRAITAGRGLFNMSDWHGHESCSTTHCRAGWAIVLAGEAGRNLEVSLGSNLAGALIYYKSTGYVPNFFANNRTAKADIKMRAAAEVTCG